MTTCIERLILAEGEEERANDSLQVRAEGAWRLSGTPTMRLLLYYLQA